MPSSYLRVLRVMFKHLPLAARATRILETQFCRLNLVHQPTVDGTEVIRKQTPPASTIASTPDASSLRRYAFQHGFPEEMVMPPNIFSEYLRIASLPTCPESMLCPHDDATHRSTRWLLLPWGQPTALLKLDLLRFYLVPSPNSRSTQAPAPWFHIHTVCTRLLPMRQLYD